jgi:hypothetical protein
MYRRGVALTSLDDVRAAVGVEHHEFEDGVHSKTAIGGATGSGRSAEEFTTAARPAIDGAQQAQPDTAIMAPVALGRVYLGVPRSRPLPAASQARRGP